MSVRFVKVLFAASLALGLTACAKKPRYKIVHPTKQELREDYTGLLNKTGAQVAIQGETVKIMVPSDILFKERSANLGECALPMLRRIGAYLPLFNPSTIKVAGYTDDSEPEKFQKLLSARQAQVVVDTLWPHGMGSAMAFAEGYGSSYPISSNESSTGRSLNRRLEIGFKFYPSTRPFD